MPPAHCGVAYLAYRTLLTNGAIYPGSGAGVGNFNGRDWPCRVKAACIRPGSWSGLDHAGLPRSGLGTLLVCISNFALFHEDFFFFFFFQECKQTVLQSARGPATSSGRAMHGTLLGGTNPSPHKRRLN